MLCRIGNRKFDEVLVMTSEWRYYNNKSCNKKDETNSWMCKVIEYDDEDEEEKKKEEEEERHL